MNPLYIACSVGAGLLAAVVVLAAVLHQRQRKYVNGLFAHYKDSVEKRLAEHLSDVSQARPFGYGTPPPSQPRQPQLSTAVYCPVCSAGARQYLYHAAPACTEEEAPADAATTEG